MFIGHYVVALAAKRLAPKTSLGTLVLAAEFADALWPIFLMAGIEHVRIAPGRIRSAWAASPYAESVRSSTVPDNNSATSGCSLVVRLDASSRKRFGSECGFLPVLMRYTAHARFRKES